MTKSAIRTLLLASTLASGATAAFAQNGPSGRNVAPPHAAYTTTDGVAGEGRDTGYGQGGSAGTRPTGANVGPGRAAMDHATGN